MMLSDSIFGLNLYNFTGLCSVLTLHITVIGALYTADIVARGQLHSPVILLNISPQKASIFCGKELFK